MTKPTPAELIALLRKGLTSFAIDDHDDALAALDDLAAALEAALATTQEGASGRMFTNEVGQTVSLWVHSLPSGQHSLQMTRGRALPEGIEALSNMELRALADVATRAAQPTQGSGDYVLVPREATQEMVQAALDTEAWAGQAVGNPDVRLGFYSAYRAMISAATPADRGK